MRSCGPSGGGPVPSATFRELLRALHAEHEREVGLLLAEVEELRGSQDVQRNNGSSTTAAADNFSSVVPCMPLMGIVRPRHLNARHRQITGHRETPAQLTALVPSEPDAELKPPPPVPFSSHPSSQDLAERGPDPDPGEVIKATKEPALLSREVRSLSRARSNMSSQHERLRETVMWPLWESHRIHRSEDAKTWLQVSLRDRVNRQPTSKSRVDLAATGALAHGGPTGAATLRHTGTQRRPDENTSRFPTLPLPPTSKVKMGWDLCAPLALLYDFVVIPLQVFQFGESLTRQVVEGIILCYWVFDVVMSFLSAYYDEQGKVVTQYREIARRYLRSWFLPDIIITGFDIVTTSISWSYVADSDKSQNVDIAKMGKFLRIARIVRTLRFIRIAKLREDIYGVQVHFDSEAMSIAWGLCLNIFTLLVLNHITACIWFWIGSNSEQQYTWLKAPFEGGRTWAEAGKWEVYFVSLHWSLTLFTPASMSVQPENLHERVYAVVCLMLAMVVFASFVSTVTAGMTRLRAMQTEQLEQSYKLRKFLQENAISLDLVARVTRYVDIAMRSNKKRVPMEAVVRLRWLSHPLHMELLWELNAPLLQGHTFFSNYAGCSASAMRQLCFGAIKTIAISTRDSLFTSFQEATCMYFVREGKLVYKRAHGLNFPRRVSLGNKDWFVEHVLWMQWVHHGTMKAVTESSMMVVDSGKFREVSCAHPDVLLMAAQYAIGFTEEVEGNESCDVPQAILDHRDMTSDVDGSFLGAAEADAVFSSESSHDEEEEERIDLDLDLNSRASPK